MEKSFEEFIDAAQKVLKDCPWIVEQSIESYAKKMHEEAEEVIDAIENGTDEELKEELGDLLWDTIMVALIAQREGKFEAKEIMHRVVQKMKHRKPYIFEGQQVTLEEAERIWQERKNQEKLQKS